VDFREFVQVPIERVSNSLNDPRMGQVSALVGDAESGESETGCGDACHAARITSAPKIVASAVEYLAGLLAGLLPEEETTLVFEIVEEGLITALWLPRCRGQKIRRQERTPAPSGQGFQNLSPGYVWRKCVVAQCGSLFCSEHIGDVESQAQSIAHGKFYHSVILASTHFEEAKTKKAMR
jgi:hypothetical protein